MVLAEKTHMIISSGCLHSTPAAVLKWSSYNLALLIFSAVYSPMTLSVIVDCHMVLSLHFSPLFFQYWVSMATIVLTLPWPVSKCQASASLHDSFNHEIFIATIAVPSPMASPVTMSQLHPMFSLSLATLMPPKLVTRRRLSHLTKIICQHEMHHLEHKSLFADLEDKL